MRLRQHTCAKLREASFDPASLLIIEKLNQALEKLDKLESPAQSKATLPAQVHDHTSSLSSCSQDSLEVLTGFASTDYVLSWPVFGGRWPSEYLSTAMHAENAGSVQQTDGTKQKHRASEDDAPELVERFLAFTHSKNPIFQPRGLREDAKAVAEHGLGWDASSCIVVGNIIPSILSHYE